MKLIKLTICLVGFLLCCCNHEDIKTIALIQGKKPMVSGKTAPSQTDNKLQIQHLIRQALNWAHSKNSIDLLPAIADKKDSLYIGFDLKKHKQNLDKLRLTSFLSIEFIENYNQIILTLDKGLRNGKYEKWLVGDLPTFGFANDINPWTMSQDVPYDKPNAFDFIEVNLITADNDRSEASWHWGKHQLNADKGWKDFSYRFTVVKDNDKWKIAYLEGFDFNESTRNDGQL